MPFVGVAVPVFKEGHQLVCGRGPEVSADLVAARDLLRESATPPFREESGVIIHFLRLDDVPK